MVDNYPELKQKVLATARECARRGPGYSQRGAVFNAVADAVGGRFHPRLPLAVQQAILTCWHDLFRDGELAWGYDLDNPNSPFFHIPERSGR